MLILIATDTSLFQISDFRLRLGEIWLLLIHNICDHAPSIRPPAAAVFGSPSFVSPTSALSPLARASVRPRLSYRSRLFCPSVSVRPSVRQCTLNVDDGGRRDNERRKERNGERERERTLLSLSASLHRRFGAIKT